MNSVLKELNCADKPTILVLNKIDRITDTTLLDILKAQHPKAVAISGATGVGVRELTDTVIESLSSHFLAAEVTVDAGNGKVLAYLNAHAEIFRQEFRDSNVVIRCYLPKHLLHYIQHPNVTVRLLEVAETAPER